MNIAIGAWLVISAFVLPQPRVSVINTCVVGAAVAAIAALALVLSRPAIRVANVILAPWLFISTIVFTSAMGAAAWNNALAAFAVLMFALVPGSRHTSAGRPHRIARGLL